MWNSAIEDVRSPDSTADGEGAGFDLGHHAPFRRPVRHHLIELLGGHLGQDRVWIRRDCTQAGNVGEEHELGRSQCCRDGPRHGVGIDVVRLAGSVRSDGGNDRDKPLREESINDRRIHRGHVSHKPKSLRPDVCADQVGIDSGEPDRQRTVHVDRGNDVAVHLSDQHHARHVEGLCVRHPQSVPELRFDADLLEQLSDLRPAPVHHDRLQPDGLQQHDVLGEGRQGLGLVCSRQCIAPVLDHDHRASELADVGKRLDQQRGCVSRIPPSLTHDVVRFSSMYPYPRSVVRIDAAPTPRPRSIEIQFHRSAMCAATAATSWSLATPPEETTIPP